MGGDDGFGTPSLFTGVGVGELSGWHRHLAGVMGVCLPNHVKPGSPPEKP